MKLNDKIALRITLTVSTMWAFYALVIFGLTPLLWPSHMTQILYWSNFVQLIFLPLLAVGTSVMGRASEQRANEDHEMIKAEFEANRNILKVVLEEQAELKELHAKLIEEVRG